MYKQKAIKTEGMLKEKKMLIFIKGNLAVEGNQKTNTKNEKVRKII